MQFKRYIFYLILTATLGCDNNVKHFYAKDGVECITIITNRKIRYIINGETYKVPVENYVKVDLSSIDKEVSDDIVGCWKFKKYRWIIMQDGVKIIENKLDTSHFIFKNKLPLDSHKIPTLLGFDNLPRFFLIEYQFYKFNRIEGDVKN